MNNKITQFAASKSASLKQNRPHITFGFGLAAVVVAGVWACKSTLKLEDTIEEIEQDLADTRENAQKHSDVAMAYTRSAMKITKLYAPAVVTAAAGVSLLVNSHNEMTRRNAALTAAYSSLSMAFEEYRDRVRNEIGEEKEQELFLKVEEEAILDEDGNERGVVRTTPASPHSRFFDEHSLQYQRNNEHNRLFLSCQQNYFNDILQSRGHLFLNEVYDNLGLPRSAAGQIVGWRYVPDGNDLGDNHVDFGIEVPYNREFVNGPEQAVLLTFNVDKGTIAEHLG